MQRKINSGQRTLIIMQANKTEQANGAHVSPACAA